MIFDSFEFAISYGLAGVLVLAIAILMILQYRLATKVSSNGDSIKELKKASEETSDECAVRKSERKADMKKIFDKIDILEKEDVKFEGSFETVDTKLDNLKDDMSTIKADTKTILNFFAQKGMDRK